MLDKFPPVLQMQDRILEKQLFESQYGIDERTLRELPNVEISTHMDRITHTMMIKMNAEVFSEKILGEPIRIPFEVSETLPERVLYPIDKPKERYLFGILGGAIVGFGISYTLASIIGLVLSGVLLVLIALALDDMRKDRPIVIRAHTVTMRGTHEIKPERHVLFPDFVAPPGQSRYVIREHLSDPRVVESLVD